MEEGLSGKKSKFEIQKTPESQTEIEFALGGGKVVQLDWEGFVNLATREKGFSSSTITEVREALLDFSETIEKAAKGGELPDNFDLIGSLHENLKSFTDEVELFTRGEIANSIKIEE